MDKHFFSSFKWPSDAGTVFPLHVMAQLESAGILSPLFSTAGSLPSTGARLSAFQSCETVETGHKTCMCVCIEWFLHCVSLQPGLRTEDVWHPVSGEKTAMCKCILPVYKCALWTDSLCLFVKKPKRTTENWHLLSLIFLCAPNRMSVKDGNRKL